MGGGGIPGLGGVSMLEIFNDPSLLLAAVSGTPGSPAQATAAGAIENRSAVGGIPGTPTSLAAPTLEGTLDERLAREASELTGLEETAFESLLEGGFELGTELPVNLATGDIEDIESAALETSGGLLGLEESAIFETAQATGLAPSDEQIRQEQQQAAAAVREQQAASVAAERTRREGESYEEWLRRFSRGRNRALAERLARLRRRGAPQTGGSLLTDGADFTPGTSSGLGPSFSL